MSYKALAIGTAVSCLLSAPAFATNFTVALAGDPGNVSTSSNEFSGLHFDNFYFPLTGLDASNAFTVEQGDMISATVTFSDLLTIPASMVRTDFLQYFSGSFSPGNTGVIGTFTLFNGGVNVATWGYSSTTSGQLASFAVLFPPNNGVVAFDSFTNDLTITDLALPAVLSGSAFSYSLVSAGSAVPEPATWAMMIAGFGVAGVAMRRRRHIRSLHVRYAR